MDPPLTVFPLGRSIARWFAGLLGLCLWAQTGQALDLSSPWPTASDIAGVEGRRITFESHSPFALSDVGTGPERDRPTKGQGTLFVPKAASAKRPVPAVILLHGAGGVLSPRELTYARQFAARGVAALVVDVFGARRDRAVSFVNRLIEITEAMFLADAYSALRFLKSRPEIDSRRVILIGFSYGGMVATYAAYAQVAKLYAKKGARFAGHVAFYAPCIADFADSRTTGAPLLMLYGGRDAIVDPKRCASVAKDLEAGGTRVETIVYKDAVHQWDGYFSGPFMIGRNLAPCHFIVERDGTVRDRWLFLPMVNSFTRKMLLALCIGRKGYLIGRDDGVRARSNRDLGRFLERILAPDRKG